MTAASRTSGVAPLAVFFDAVNTASPAWTSGVVQPSNGDYASFNYQWDFGDPGSGNWTLGRLNPDGTYPSKNKASGYTAMHVFETPGTYTVNLTVTQSDGAIKNYSQTITVSAFSGTTYYVSSSKGNDSNFGTSPNAPLKSFDAAMTKLAANTQILFKRDDVFTTSKGATLPANGPGIIGAYDAGNRPQILASGGASLFHMDSTSDWRIADLDMQDDGTGYGIFNVYQNDLVLRCRFSKFIDGMVVDRTSEGIAIVDSEFLDNKEYGAYLDGRAHQAVFRGAVMGSRFDQVGAHLLRTYINKAVIAHNDFQRAGINQIKFCGALAPTEVAYGIIADNKFWNHQGSWMVSFGPEDNLPNQYELVRDLVIERNLWSLAQETGGVPLQSRGADHVTVLNNLFLGGVNPISISQAVQGFSTWTDWRIYNNTFVKTNNPNEETVFIRWENSVGHLWSVRNNIVSFPNATDGHVFWGPPEMLANIASDYNQFYIPHTTSMSYIGANSYTLGSWPSTGQDTHSKVGNPLFVNETSSDLRLQAASPAINSGTGISGAFEDFDTMPRPQGTGYEIGAYEFKSGTVSSSSSLSSSSSSSRSSSGGSSLSNSPSSAQSSSRSSSASSGSSSSVASSLPSSSSVGSSNSSSSAPPASGLAAHLKLDETSGATAADSSGNNNTGTLQNGPSWSAGHTNGALSLNGSQYVSIPDASTLRFSSSYTLAGWIKPQVLGGFGTVLIKESLTAGGCGYWLQTNDAEVSAGFNNGSTCVEHLSSGAGLQIGQWHHVAAVFDDAANTFKIYVNGVLKNSANQTEAGTPASNTYPLYLGRTSQSNEYFNGSLDEVRLYNRALSAAEIQDLYIPTNSPPQITLQPQDKIVDEGFTATFTTAASGSGTLNYQWQRNGVNISGATAASYTTPTLTLADSGASYRVFVSNAYGNATSNAALLTVNKATAVAWPLRINAAGRYFEDQAGNPFLISGEAGWLIATQISQEDAVAYLDNIKAKGFNTVELMMISTFQNNTPNNYYNEPPFTNGPTNWSVRNEAYWARVDFILMQLRMRGMVALAFPAYLGYECGSEGWCQQVLAQTDAAMTNYGQWIGNRYKDYGNIIWMTGGDVDASQFGQAASRNAAIVSGIRSADSDAIFSAEPHSDQVGGIDSYASLLNVNSVYTYGHPQSLVNRAYSSSTKPFIFQEGYYENEWSSPTVYQDAQALITYLGGGLGGHIFGACPLWGFGTTRDSRCPLTAPYFDTWRHNLESPGSIAQGAIARLMRSRKWWTMAPDYSNAVVTSSKGGEMDYHAAASNGETIMVWAPNTNTITVNTTKIGGTSVRAWWFSTVDGTSSLIGTYATGTMSFTPSAARKVLVIDNAALNLAAPGTTVYQGGGSSSSSSVSSSSANSISSTVSSSSSSSLPSSSRSSQQSSLPPVSSSSLSSSVQSSAQSSSRSSALSSSSSLSSAASSSSFSSSLSSSSSSALSLNPVLDMRFDDAPSAGVVKDSSQYANSGSCTPGVSCPILANGAYTFDGTNDAVTVQNTALFNFDRYTPFTLSAWVSNLAPSSCAPIIAKGLAPASKAYKGYALGLDCLNGTRLELSLIQNSNKRQAIVVTGSTNITAPGWHHVAATYDGTNKASGIKLYVDGVLETPSRQSGSLKGSISTTYPLKIGASSQPLFLTGMVDEVKVFNSALDAGLIGQTYNARIAATSQTSAAFASVAVKSSTASSLNISALVANPDEVKAVYMTISSYGLRTAVQDRSQRRDIRVKLKLQSSSTGHGLYGGTLNLQNRLLALRGRIRVTVYAVTTSGEVITYSKAPPRR